MPHANFVPLRVFSAYTMLEGAIEPKALAKQAKKLGFPACALADRNGLYAAMPFSEAAMAAGVQPVIGTLLAVARPGTERSGGGGAGKPPIIDWLPLYAQDERGYDNLCALVSSAHLDRPVHEPAHVELHALEGRTEGVIALTGAREGALAQLFAEGQIAAAQDYADWLQALFPERLYVEIARREDPVETAAEGALIELAYARGLPLVATNPTCYAEPDFHAAHDAMLCIADSAYVESNDRRTSCQHAWMKPAEEMERLFADLPEAIQNTLVVARRCAVAAPKRKPILPSLAGDREAEARMLGEEARAGLAARLDKIRPSLDFARDERSWEEYCRPYYERLEFEIDVITGMGFPGYFLIVAEFIQWAKSQGIPVGPGRGSGAGSVVAWALTITDLDPLKLGLLFERFLNPERVSMPDFDIDFCETRRDEVIRHVQEKYGHDHVAQIITFGKLKARAVLKDTGRVLQMSYGQVDRLAKLVPNHPTDPWTLDRTLEKGGVAEFRHEYDLHDDVRRLVDLAMKLEGLPRHSSTHAAGVVIGDRPLAQLVPLYRDPRSDMPVTQFDMKYVEAAGLVKFDFLGLKTLSVLQRAVELLDKRGVKIDLEGLAWDDPKVYELLQRGETVGVFQLESEGMRRTLSAVRPTCFEDIIALVSLYRPGPMDNIPMFGARKNGREKIEYPHPLLEGVLAETYGIFVYQEQVMQAAQILAGYSLGEADLLRRAMGKKIKAEMDAQRSRFVEGCAEKQITPAKANELFDLIDKFAGYGFNKSHAAAYALVAYHTAWLKTYHLPEFYAASMAYDITVTDKLQVFVDDMRRLGVRMLPPCVNRSEADFTVEEDADGLAVRYALGGLKGVGEKAMADVVRSREADGPFKSLDDFAERIDPRQLNKRQIESLAGAGAFDGLHAERASVHASAETILAHASVAADQRNSGQHGLFGDSGAGIVPIRLAAVAPWGLAERMAQEKDAFGFYLSAHPVDRYGHLLASHGVKSFAALAEGGGPVGGGRTSASMAALMEEARWRTSQSGKRYLLATCSDQSGQFIASIFDDDAQNAVEEAARANECALLSVELLWRPEEDTPRVTIRGLTPLDSLSKRTRINIELTVTNVAALPLLAEELKRAGGGRGEVSLRLKDAELEAVLKLGRTHALDAELAARLEYLPGVAKVTLTADEGPRLALVS